ncbi:MAG: hypothetical protein FJY77_00330 [Candidatus Altiarchaeales archaeon]|nr:hypothetical protein [Candidatus Altiarchaeales archaeon]
MDKQLRGGLIFLAVVLAIHLFLGLFAVSKSGLFVYGATVVERYLIHLLSNSEVVFNPTGAAYYHLNDLCFQKVDSPLLCYHYSDLNIDCDSCLIKTKRGTLLALPGSYYPAVVKKGMILEDVVFNCYRENNTMCGFEEDVGENYSYLHYIV